VATDYVATRWYRAPENLLGTKEYSCLIDVFSLACVVVELYLGNPLFPGADNIDQLYRIFNILGEPNESNWPLGYNKYREMGFKSDPQRGHPKKGEEVFGLRSLLKACSEGLVALLEKMLVLNPKKRITTREIVLDPYFHDVKAIIPPSIYKRFEKDHIFRKTTSKEVIENAESFINNTRSKLTRTQGEENYPSSLAPNKTETNNSNCALISFNLSPRKPNIMEEELRPREIDFKKTIGIHAITPRQQNISLKQEQPPQPGAQNSILAFRGFNPIKNNKVSVK
jgi:serine/threonine protein kinase